MVGFFESQKFTGKTPIPNVQNGANMGNPGVPPNKKTFEDLHDAPEKVQVSMLYNLFDQLNRDFRVIHGETFADCWSIYSGNDIKQKEKLAPLFNNSDVIYDSFELNSIVKNIAAKTIQPFFSRDSLIIPIPTPDTVDIYERVATLLDQQLKNSKVTSEIYKTVKDGYTYGIGYVGVGWESKTIKAPKTKITSFTKLDPETGEEIVDTIREKIEEEVSIEEPSIYSIRVSDVLFPRCARWEDLPYCLRIERVSNRVYDERYSEFLKKKKSQLHPTGDASKWADNMKTRLDDLLDRVPGQTISVGDGAIDEIVLVHFHFKDGTYYILSFDHTNTGSGTLVFAGESPVAGLPIPIFPFVPEPVTHRIIGESLVLVAKNDAQKTMELDNIIMRDVRKDAASSFFINEMAGFDLVAWENRPPNVPFKISGDLKDGILLNPITNFKPELLNIRQQVKNTLDATTGVNDFFSGNIGRSARLSGVDSLLANALSRLSPAMNQLELFVHSIGQALLMLNREFLPETYVQLKSSVYVSEPIEAHEIPLPFKFKIATAVTSAAEKEVLLAGLSKAVEIAIAQEEVTPGKWDIDGLLAHYLTTLGAPQVKRFMLKQPMTKSEAQQLTQIDQAMRMQNNTSLQPQETPDGMPMDVAQQQGMPSGGVSSQSSRPPGITETNPL